MNKFTVLFVVFACTPFVTAERNICLVEGVNPDGELLPHESDCNKFYKCAHGVPVQFSCPKGLEFNPTTKECDWAESSGCSRPPITWKPCIPPAPPVCPPHETSKPAVYLQHETDCRKYYQCDWEVPHLHDCPEGLHFSVFNKVCDWPERAGCAC